MKKIFGLLLLFGAWQAVGVMEAAEEDVFGKFLEKYKEIGKGFETELSVIKNQMPKDKELSEDEEGKILMETLIKVVFNNPPPQHVSDNDLTELFTFMFEEGFKDSEDVNFMTDILFKHSQGDDEGSTLHPQLQNILAYVSINTFKKTVAKPMLASIIQNDKTLTSADLTTILEIRVGDPNYIHYLKSLENYPQANYRYHQQEKNLLSSLFFEQNIMETMDLLNKLDAASMEKQLATILTDRYIGKDVFRQSSKTLLHWIIKTREQGNIKPEKIPKLLTIEFNKYGVELANEFLGDDVTLASIWLKDDPTSAVPLFFEAFLYLVDKDLQDKDETSLEKLSKSLNKLHGQDLQGVLPHMLLWVVNKQKDKTKKLDHHQLIAILLEDLGPELSKPFLETNTQATLNLFFKNFRDRQPPQKQKSSPNASSEPKDDRIIPILILKHILEKIDVNTFRESIATPMLT